MHVPHEGRAPVAVCVVVQRLELLKFLAPDAAALGEQRGQGLRPGTEGCRLFQQHRVPVEDLAEGGAQHHRLALLVGPRAQLVPGGQHLGALGCERVDHRAVTPPIDRMANLVGDAHDRVVVCRGPGLGMFIQPITGCALRQPALRAGP